MRVGKAPVLEPADVHALLDSIDITRNVELCNRVLIAPMVYFLARLGALLTMKVEDMYT